MDDASPADQMLFEDMLDFTDGKRRPFIHLVDGGLSDNLGIRGLFNMQTLARGRSASTPSDVPIRRFVVITVNAANGMGSTIDEWPDIPSTNAVFGALVDIPMARRSRETELLVKELERRRGRELEAAGKTRKTDIENYYAINVSFRGVTDTAVRRSLLSLPTTWKLSTDQIELLRSAGAQLVRQSPDFQRLLRDIGGESVGATR